MTCHSLLPGRVTCRKRVPLICRQWSARLKVDCHKIDDRGGVLAFGRKSLESKSRLRSRTTSDSTFCSATAQSDQLYKSDRKGTDSRQSKLKMEESIAKRMLSDPDLEGEPLKLLRTMEAFWKAGLQMLVSCTPFLSSVPLLRSA